jgi:hypothetical protein
MVFGSMQLPMLIALAMVGYLAAVTQSPITSFVIVMEMINGHALVISLMATALIASRVSRMFAPALYEALSERYLAPLPRPAPAPVPEVPEVDAPEANGAEGSGEASGDGSADVSADAPSEAPADTPTEGGQQAVGRP